MTTHPAWYYNELQQVGVDFEDIAQVAAYDRKQKSNTPEINQTLIHRLGITTGQTVIEIGTGTGNFAIEAAKAGAHVHAVDISTAMLSYAHQKAVATNTANIEFHHAGFLTYKHTGEPADYIVTKAAFHHLPDFWKQVGLLRMSAMLKPHGILYLRDVIFSFNPAEYHSHINDWINHFAQPSSEGFTNVDYKMHIREEYSTFNWIMEGMLTRSGFQIISTDYPSTTQAEYICQKIGV